MGEARKGKPGPADEAAAARLKAIWLENKSRLGLTQETAAQYLKITQAAVNQYLDGKIRLGFKKLMQFSELLECDPADIRTDLPEQRFVTTKPIGVRENQTPYHPAPADASIEVALQSLLTAMIDNVPAAAGTFVEAVQLLASRRKDQNGAPVSTDSGPLARLIHIAKQAQRKKEAAARRSVRRVPVHKSK